MFDAFADASPDLLATVANTTRFSDTVVDQQDSLDALLVSAIGLADIGTEVLSDNRQPLTDVLRLLVPTTDLTNQYNAALTCGIGGLMPLATGPGSPVARGGSAAGVLPRPGALPVPGQPAQGRRQGRTAVHGPAQRRATRQRPPFVVSDIGANQAQYGNQGILLNSDGLKQALFGPLDGPPRNTAQIGQPG